MAVGMGLGVESPLCKTQFYAVEWRKCSGEEVIQMDSIIFDLDGTLWNPLEVSVAVWNKVLADNGVEEKLSKDDLRGIMGLQADQVGEKLFPHLSKEQCEKLTEESVGADTDLLKSTRNGASPAPRH